MYTIEITGMEVKPTYKDLESLAKGVASNLDMPNPVRILKDDEPISLGELISLALKVNILKNRVVN